MLGFAGLARRRPPEELEVRIWVTEGAAAHPDVAERAAGYVRQALEAAGMAVVLSFGESPVAPSTEDDQRVRRMGWPRMVLEGAVGLGDIDPARDVNLLLTDGDAIGETAGYASENIAAVAGAKHLAEMAPADQTPAVVDYSAPTAITQLLLHECGHALGLTHDHGAVVVEGDTTTVSPMIGGYAWAPGAVRKREFDDETNACNEPVPPVTDHHRRLSIDYSGCAETAIRRYRTGLLP